MKRFTIPKLAKKFFKISGLTIGSILLLMFLLPFLFPDFVSKKIKMWANNAITTELNFSKARLSFFNHFPSLTLTLYDCSLKGSKPFANDTLINAKEIALGINLASVFSSQITIDEIYLTNSNINVQVSADGIPNYNIYNADTTARVKQGNDSSSASLKIERIEIDKSNLIYNDRSIPILIDAKNINYLGKGNLSKAIFDLASSIKTDSFNLSYNGEHYIGSKKLQANLVTKINTNSLSFIFEKNELVLNKLPFSFNGKFEFMKNGYDMNFKLSSVNTNLYDVLSAVPPAYMPWFEKMDANGKTEINASLMGQYIASKNIKPNLQFSFNVFDGYLDYEKAPASLKNLLFKFSAKLPQLNTDSLKIDLDTLHFTVDKSYLNAALHTVGINHINVKAFADAELDAEKLFEAIGIKELDVKGNYKCKFNANGNYYTKVVRNGIRKVDTVIASIPSFNLQSSFTNGYVKYKSVAKPVENINFNINASCVDNNYSHTVFLIENINATAADNFIKGYIKAGGNKNIPIDANIQSNINLASVKEFYPLSEIDLKGKLIAHLIMKGNFNTAKKIFPVAAINLNLNDGKVQTKYYPSPIDKINVAATIVSKRGSLKDLSIDIKPISFMFEGQPFLLQANMQNFTNINYNIKSSGVIDVGKIYKVFSKKGIDVKGLIKTNLSLQGTQANAIAKKFDKLYNAGTLSLKNFAVTTDYFPKPFLIKNGILRFEQDKIWLQNIATNYGNSDLLINGYLNNIINYTMNDKETLHGEIALTSNTVNVNEFMAYANDSSKNTNTKAGVVMIPTNLSVTVNANVNKIKYNDISLNNFKGQLIIDSGILKLNETGFDVIGTKANMNAVYKSITPTKALFDYNIKATDFDIARAYKEIKIFHDMASAAAYCKGIVSINYHLKGRLDANMFPVYPSIQGGGTLSLQKIKVKGFKLFTAVSKATNKDSLNNPDLSKVDINTTIANNIITIEKVKMRVFGFRPRFEGQVSFDGKLNLKGRVGLPPLGIFGIPFSVTGTQNNPVIKLKRSNAGKLEETEDKEEQ
ncbi:MAG: AsmA family protein [Bacteroidetes bacterium]|nr:AsmA family protein [Bacteroidota bacterium]MBS1648346.1 AsmA family protein [Bacteroidota bacterium]